ncbi:hypothetical protein NA57DRAFT_57137 [Rhizodiscina lignyota]|uniref:DUF6604 domain-containing protein n=1 Tax=Rhizodiscina lignyota TaxID=1504668 RepID=A0A9P4IET8_9PEZI|nr:hypothetical protein NA57DRAFT_57137 [Rhizodiscina lignyota]
MYRNTRTRGQRDTRSLALPSPCGIIFKLMASTTDFRRPIQYKAKNEKFVSWLRDQARKLKIKQPTGVSEENKSASLTTEQLKHLAADVAEALPQNTPIPPHVFYLLEGVIRDRKAAAQWHQELAPPFTSKTHASNKRHKYFIKVLEDILHALRKARGNEAARRQKKLKRDQDALLVNETTRPVRELQNMYEPLEVFSVSPEDTEPEVQPEDDKGDWDTEETDADDSNSNPIFDSKPADDDRFCAILSFFKDFARLRFFVRNTWTDYRRHKISLTNAATLTRLATLLAGDKVVELYESPHAFSGMNGVAEFLQKYLHPDATPLHLCKVPPELQPMSKDELFESHMFCYSSFKALLEVQDQVILAMDELRVREKFSMSAEELIAQRRSKLNPVVLKAHRDEYLMDVAMHVVGAISSASHRNEDLKELPNTLELLAPVMALLLNHRLIGVDFLSFVMFTLQGEVRKGIGHSSGAAYEDFKTNIHEIMRSVIAWNVPRIGLDKLLATMKSDFARTLRSFDFVPARLLYDITRYLPGKDSPGPQLSPEQMSGASHIEWLLKENPYLSGTFLKMNHWKCQDYGIEQANESLAVHVLVHLYVACRQLGILKKAWQLLDDLIEVQGEQYLFFGGLPTNAHESFVKFGLAFSMDLKTLKQGVGPDEIARLSLHGKVKRSYRHTDLERIAWDKCDSNGQNGWVHIFQLLKEDPEPDAEKNGKHQHQRPAPVSESEALKRVTMRLKRDEKSSSFDYIRLCARARQVLRLVDETPQIKNLVDGAIGRSRIPPAVFQHNEQARYVMNGFVVLKPAAGSYRYLEEVSDRISHVAQFDERLQEAGVSQDPRSYEEAEEMARSVLDAELAQK